MSSNPNRPPTEFEEKIYSLILTIPRGKVATYKMVARAIGCGSCQAVGQALKRNPFAPRVPCHRVIASDLSMGGFAGQRSGNEIDNKLRLLEEEGVVFVEGRLAEPCRLYEFSAQECERCDT
ncbi:MAG: MGMT family protein [Verrucomicrobia bacterium]|nr:MGMT family protein [Verrucomicrobiota bacterium]MBT7068830.1 MGMT family protein [Verrucomicrobiota bacterium]MBT7699886.1 MGMT family protein [Verrucomicrobiota bacterium]